MSVHLFSLFVTFLNVEVVLIHAAPKSVPIRTLRVMVLQSNRGAWENLFVAYLRGGPFSSLQYAWRDLGITNNEDVC